jgi:hypothetical protein
MTESTLVDAQGACIYPRVARAVDGARLVRARGYGSDREIGSGGDLRRTPAWGSLRVRRIGRGRSRHESGDT